MITVTLKKARQVLKELKAKARVAANNHHGYRNATVSYHDDSFELSIKEQRDALMSEFTIAQRLSTATFKLRALVETANTQHGITPKIAELASLQARLAVVNSYTALQPISDAEFKSELKKFVFNQNKLKTAVTSSAYDRDAVALQNWVSPEFAETVKAAAKDLKEKISAVQDELTYLNAKNHVVLDEETAQDLAAYL